MASKLTTDQVIGLAPDGASVAAARKFATRTVWSESGCDATSVWGCAKGSGTHPYQVSVDLAGPAYRCSCPSRKIPCKHVLGLLLLLSGGEVDDGAPPAFVTEWLAARGERQEKAAVAEAKRGASEADPEARAARVAKRAAAVAAGLEDLERFLADLVREGMGVARERPAGWWDAQARRLVDAQAPALAERIRALGATLHAGREDWPVRALTQAAMLHLVVRGWRRGDELVPDLRDDLRAHLGWARATREVVQESAAEPGPWAVVGIRVEAQERLRIRRTWLLRAADQRIALLLDFAAAGAVFERSYALGAVLAGDLHPYPGRSGVRVAPGRDLEIVGAWEGPGPGATIASGLLSWSRALAADPLIDRLALAVSGVTPIRGDGRWWLQSDDGASLPIVGSDPWPLVSVAAGQPIGAAGEWDGDGFTLMCVHAEGRVRNMAPRL